MNVKYRAIFFIFMLFIISIIVFFLIKDYQFKHRKIEEKPYTDFVSLIKSGDYLEAYKNLYPLVLKNDPKAMKLIGDAYYEEYGVERDLIKAKIWYQKSENMGRNGGGIEYSQAMVFLKIKDYGMASEFLQKSAELGNRDAIEKIKSEEFVKLNKLNIDPNWKEYWKRFDYEDLYPYSREIKNKLYWE